MIRNASSLPPFRVGGIRKGPSNLRRSFEHMDLNEQERATNTSMLRSNRENDRKQNLIRGKKLWAS
jgi:hypothetical protein